MICQKANNEETSQLDKQDAYKRNFSMSLWVQAIFSLSERT